MKIKEHLERGNCLVLLDGLDEVASDQLRRRVAKDIRRFIISYTTDSAHARHANRFMITSRIVGYEEGPFRTATHYTLLELTDEQIEHFLMTWCPAVERHMARSAEPTRHLTAQQDVQANIAGKKQRDPLRSVALKIM